MNQMSGGLVISSGMNSECQVVWVQESFKGISRRLSAGLMYV